MSKRKVSNKMAAQILSRLPFVDDVQGTLSNLLDDREADAREMVELRAEVERLRGRLSTLTECAVCGSTVEPHVHPYCEDCGYSEENEKRFRAALCGEEG